MAQLNACAQGWVNHVRYGDTWGLRRALFRTAIASSMELFMGARARRDG